MYFQVYSMHIINLNADFRVYFIYIDLEKANGRLALAYLL